TTAPRTRAAAADHPVSRFARRQNLHTFFLARGRPGTTAARGLAGKFRLTPPRKPETDGYGNTAPPDGPTRTLADRHRRCPPPSEGPSPRSGGPMEARPDAALLLRPVWQRPDRRRRPVRRPHGRLPGDRH